MANGPADFQDEIHRLAELLPTAEPDNFVLLRIVRDETVADFPSPPRGAEVWFRKDAAATLARYTSDSRIFPRQGGFSESAMQARSQVWIDRLEPTGIAWGIAGDPTTGLLEIDVGITESEFRALAAEKGWPWNDDVRFTFAAEQPPAFGDPSLERQVRAFIREPTRRIIQLTALTIGTIQVDGGCFRLMGKNGQKGPLVLFGYDVQLTRDSEGFIAVEGKETRYRIGEVGAWGGPNQISPDWQAVRSLRKICGEGEIVNVGNPQSLRLFALPYADWVLDYAVARSLSYDAAWDEVIACMARKERRGRIGTELRDACIDQFNDR